MPPDVQELLDRALSAGERPANEHAVSVVAADLVATLGSGPGEADEIARREAQHLARWTGDNEAFELAEKVQQWLMDTFIDTTWPSCPDHPNHPLWLSGDDPPMWTCPRTGQQFCQLGQLASLISPSPAEMAAKGNAWPRRTLSSKPPWSDHAADAEAAGRTIRRERAVQQTCNTQRKIPSVTGA